ncbi:putative CCA tRNA nucleotidyltransferase 2 isoform X1 [Tanacetum coccineum]
MYYEDIFVSIHLITKDQFNLESKLFVAGGRVNDKLLKEECYDIDIASDNNILGKELCEKVNEYMVSTGEEIQGSEDYTVNSRIPIMKFGCAEQDAYRRDLIVNSFNPGNHQKLFDDSFRVIKDIHFSARFEFENVEELKAAVIVNDDVKSVIVDKSVENGLVMRYQAWSLLQEIPNTPYLIFGYAISKLPRTYIIGNQLYYQDYEWYEALEESELKDEALRNKAIMEEIISDDDDESRCPRARNIDEYWWRIYKFGNLEVLES